MSDPISKDARKRLIVALDTDLPEQALILAKCLRNEIGMLKVGMELFPRSGPGLVKAIQDEGIDVFLDLKYHDIPNTVAGAIRTAAALGVRLCTVHASGGPKMLKAASDAAKASKLTVLAVTILTSLDDEDLEEIGYAYAVKEETLRLTNMAVRCGITGIVSSAQETSSLLSKVSRNLTIVNPGVRFPKEDVGDQKRVVTPDQAIVNGASYLVVGRPITKADDPVSAARKFVHSIAMGMVERSGG